MAHYILIFLIGLFAQFIDGGLGMGYGVTSTSLLLTLGFGTALASASVHMAEIFTTFVSGISHWKFENIDKRIVILLSGPGVIGGALGAYLAVKYQETAVIKFVVSSILLLMGLIILYRFLLKKQKSENNHPRKRFVGPLGFLAAFIDAIGGGGWGPIAAPSLILKDVNPRKAVGSVNLAEFFITLVISITFFITLPKIEWKVVLFLIFGGMITAPFAAYLTKKLPHKALGAGVGILIIVLSLRTILKYFGFWFPF